MFITTPYLGFFIDELVDGLVKIPQHRAWANSLVHTNGPRRQIA